MKFSELSYRDYIAIEVVGHFAALDGFGPKGAAQHAYGLADAMLAEAGKRDLEMAELREEAETAKRTLEILRPTGDGETFIRIALDQVWLLLGVNNQTHAMQKLNELAVKAPTMAEALDAIANWPSDIPGSLRDLAKEALS